MNNPPNTAIPTAHKSMLFGTIPKKLIITPTEPIINYKNLFININKRIQQTDNPKDSSQLFIAHMMKN